MPSTAIEYISRSAAVKGSKAVVSAVSARFSAFCPQALTESASASRIAALRCLLIYLPPVVSVVCRYRGTDSGCARNYSQKAYHALNISYKYLYT